MAIKAIIFDCFGVLLVAPGFDALLRDFPQHKIEINDLILQSDYGIISLQQFNNSIAKLTGLQIREVESQYWDINVRDETVISWVHELKLMGKYKIGLLSNVGSGWLDGLLPETSGGNLFDATVLSHDVGMIKPDPKIFELIAEKLDVTPHECIMIDDRPSNIDGAEHADMRGIVFESIDQTRAELEHLLELHNA